MSIIISCLNNIYENKGKIICINYDSLDWSKENHLYKFLIKPNSEQIIYRELEKNNYKEVQHPKGKEAGYRMLYQIKSPRLFQNEKEMVEIWEELCCMSYFQNCWLPLDKITNQTAWDNYDFQDGYYLLNEIDRLVYNITNCFFTERSFKFTIRGYLENNASLLDNDIVRKKLEKEFFSFTDILLDHLKSHKYEEVFIAYKSFINY